METHILASRRFKEKCDLEREAVRRQAIQQWTTLKTDPRFMAFIGLYLGEGTKSSGRGKKTSKIGIANSDPAVIKFCLECFQMFATPQERGHKFDMWIMIYNDHDRNVEMEFWEHLTGLEISRIKTKKRGAKGNSPHGTCYITFSNWRMYHKIMTWLECFRREVMNP